MQAPLTGSAARRPRHWALIAALLAGVVACYVPALPGPYQFDDSIGIAVDPAAASLSVWWQAPTSHVRPLSKASFAVSHGLGERLGHAPMGHRLVNVTIHLAAIALLWRLALQLSATCLPRTRARDAAVGAALAAALFGLHPLATEAVSYLSGRSMALGTVLAGTCLLAWIRARTLGSRGWSVAALGLAVLAALARESVVFSIPLLVGAWELLRRDRSAAHFGASPRAWRAAVPFAAVAVAALLAMSWHDRYAELLRMSAWIAQVRRHDASLITALGYFGGALSLLRAPTIDPDVSAALSGATRWAAGAGLMGLLWWAWRVRERHPQWLLAALWVLAWLLPLYAWPVRHDVVSERHFYPALWGVAWAVGVTLAPALQRGTTDTARAAAVRGAVGTLILVLSALTAARNLDYRSEVSLWEAAERSAPRKVRVLNNLGVAYMEAGRWAEAARVLNRALLLDPQHGTVPWNLAAARRRDLGVLREPVLLDWPQPVHTDTDPAPR